MNIGIETLTILISGVLSWALTFAVSLGLKKDHPTLKKLRSALPALATLLAILFVGVDQHLEGVEVVTWETLKGGLIAGAGAVLMHSQGKEALKLLAGIKAPPSQALLVTMLGVVVWMGAGCSSAPEIVGPGLQLQSIEGECGPEWQGETSATVTHPALWPEGWTQETTTTVKTRLHPPCQAQDIAPTTAEPPPPSPDP